MTREVRTIDAAQPVTETMAVSFVLGQLHRACPVPRGGQLVGVIDRAGLAALGARSSTAQVGEACEAPPQVALPGERCRVVATRMARLRVERLPVVKDVRSFELVGIVARSDPINPSFVHFDEEEKRERLRGMPWQAKV